jgi:hypothetical protein
MATQTKVPLEEYLRTSYEPDREFLDVLRVFHAARRWPKKFDE